MLVYPSGVDVSSPALRFLTQQLRRHRREIGSRWRRLSAGRQALLTLAHLRVGHTYAQLAAGFGVGTATAYRYVTEAVELLAALAPSLADAVQSASATAYLILDGTLLPYPGSGCTVRVPRWGRWETLSAGQKAVNRSHAKIRALVEPGRPHPSSDQLRARMERAH